MQPQKFSLVGVVLDLIKFSKKLMAKFGSIILKRFHERSLNPKSIKYRIDWRYSTSKYLRAWIKDQVNIPSLEVYAFAEMLKRSRHDLTIVNILRWVNSNIQYMSDKKRWNTVEKWQTAKETLKFKTGDCECMSILVFVLARLCGIPEYQIRIVCGTVVSGNKTGGHCWVEYRSDTNGVVYYIDACYNVDLRSVTTRNYAIHYKNYLKVWWGFSDRNYFKGYKCLGGIKK